MREMCEIKANMFGGLEKFANTHTHTHTHRLAR